MSYCGSYRGDPSYVGTLARSPLYAPRFEAESGLQRCRDSVVGARNRRHHRYFYADQWAVVAAASGRASRKARADIAGAARQQAAAVVPHVSGDRAESTRVHGVVCLEQRYGRERRGTRGAGKEPRARGYRERVFGTGHSAAAGAITDAGGLRSGCGERERGGDRVRILAETFWGRGECRRD